MSTRKKRNPPKRKLIAQLLPTTLDLPVWEYREYAGAVAADTGQTADEVLHRLLIRRIRVISPGSECIDEVTPAQFAGEFADARVDATGDLHEWLATMTVLHDDGFCEWDASLRAHRLTYRDSAMAGSAGGIAHQTVDAHSGPDNPARPLTSPDSEGTR